MFCELIHHFLPEQTMMTGGPCQLSFTYSAFMEEQSYWSMKLKICLTNRFSFQHDDGQLSSILVSIIIRTPKCIETRGQVIDVAEKKVSNPSIMFLHHSSMTSKYAHQSPVCDLLNPLKSFVCHAPRDHDSSSASLWLHLVCYVLLLQFRLSNH